MFDVEVDFVGDFGTLRGFCDAEQCSERDNKKRKNEPPEHREVDSRGGQVGWKERKAVATVATWPFV